MTIMAPISAGELIDKITILSIKYQRIKDKAKLRNIQAEFARLLVVRDQAFPLIRPLVRSVAELTEVNDSLWHVEDEIREHEIREDFGDRFIELARSVYQLNDRRCRIKRQIDELVSSDIVEEKSHIF